jgi:bacteriorhodopsin
VLCVTTGCLIGARSEVVENMFGIIAAVLIVLWLLGFLAFHVSSGLIHVLLVVGIVMLLMHFFRGRAATA